MSKIGQIPSFARSSPSTATKIREKIKSIYDLSSVARLNYVTSLDTIIANLGFNVGIQ